MIVTMANIVKYQHVSIVIVMCSRLSLKQQWSQVQPQRGTSVAGDGLSLILAS